MPKIGAAWIEIASKLNAGRVRKDTQRAVDVILKVEKRAQVKTQKVRLSAKRKQDEKIARLAIRAKAENLTRDKRAAKKTADNALKEHRRMLKKKAQMDARQSKANSARIKKVAGFLGGKVGGGGGGGLAGIGAGLGSAGGPLGALAGGAAGLGLDVLKKMTSLIGSLIGKIVKLAAVIVNKLVKAFSAVIKKAVRITKIFALVGAAASALAIRMAMMAESIQSMFRFIFEESTADAKKWAENFGQAIGRTPIIIQKQLSIFFNMIKAIGIGKAASLDLAKAFTQLTQDMASFFGATVTVEQAFLKLTSGLTGEVEPLKRVGILIKEGIVNQFAWDNGIADTNKQLSEQQKLLARALLILERTRNMHNNLIDTLEEAVNQWRSLRDTAGDVARAFGAILLPSFKRVLTTLRVLAAGMKDFLITNQAGFTKLAMSVTSRMSEMALSVLAFASVIGGPLLKKAFAFITGGGLVASLGDLSKTLANFLDGMVEIRNRLKTQLPAVAEAFSKTFQAIAKAAEASLGPTLKAIDSLSKGINAIVGVAEKGSIKISAGILKGAAKGASKGFERGKTQGLLDAILAAVVGGGIGAFRGGQNAGIVEGLESIFGKKEEGAVSKIGDDLKAAIGDLLAPLGKGDAIGPASKRLTDFFAKLKKDQESVTKTRDEWLKQYREILDRISDEIAAQKELAAAQDKVAGGYSSIMDVWRRVTAAAFKMVPAVKKATDATLGKDKDGAGGKTPFGPKSGKPVKTPFGPKSGKPVKTRGPKEGVRSTFTKRVAKGAKDIGTLISDSTKRLIPPQAASGKGFIRGSLPPGARRGPPPSRKAARPEVGVTLLPGARTKGPPGIRGTEQLDATKDTNTLLDKVVKLLEAQNPEGMLSG